MARPRSALRCASLSSSLVCTELLPPSRLLAACLPALLSQRTLLSLAWKLPQALGPPLSPLLLLQRLATLLLPSLLLLPRICGIRQLRLPLLQGSLLLLAAGQPKGAGWAHHLVNQQAHLVPQRLPTLRAWSAGAGGLHQRQEHQGERLAVPLLAD